MSKSDKLAKKAKITAEKRRKQQEKLNKRLETRLSRFKPAVVRKAQQARAYATVPAPSLTHNYHLTVLACDQCNKVFARKKSSVKPAQNYFCSAKCANKWRSENKSILSERAKAGYKKSVKSGKRKPRKKQQIALKDYTDDYLINLYKSREAFVGVANKMRKQNGRDPFVPNRDYYQCRKTGRNSLEAAAFATLVSLMRGLR